MPRARQGTRVQTYITKQLKAEVGALLNEYYEERPLSCLIRDQLQNFAASHNGDDPEASAYLINFEIPIKLANTVKDMLKDEQFCRPMEDFVTELIRNACINYTARKKGRSNGDEN